MTAFIGKLGWKKDSPDPLHRDFLLMEPPPLEGLPASITLTMPPVYDQGDLGSCTAHATAAMMHYDRIKENLPAFIPSRLMIYYGTRDIEGTIDEDSGGELRDALKTVATVGACDEALWPYEPNQFRTKPAQAAYAAALNDRAIIYSRVTQSVVSMMTNLANGWPFVFGFSVFESFNTKAMQTTGIMPMPGADEQILGGHAVCCVGYRMAEQVMIIRNSWGPSWGQQGYFTMPFAFIRDTDYCSDFWTIRTVGRMATQAELSKATEMTAEGWVPVSPSGGVARVYATTLMQKAGKYTWIAADGTTRDATPDEVAKW